MSRYLKALGMITTLIVVVMGIAIAMWSGALRTNASVETGEVDWEIMSGTLIVLDACGLQPGYGQAGGNDWNASNLPEPGAVQLDKDVGCTEVELVDSDGDGDMDTLMITLHNVYPWYYTHVAFKVHNDGTVPIKIWRVVIDGREYYELNEQALQEGVYIDADGDGVNDTLIWWGDNFGQQLEPCQSADISLDITVLQTADEGATYTINITFQAIQWNEYSTAKP